MPRTDLRALCACLPLCAFACADDPTFGTATAALGGHLDPPRWTAWTTDGAAPIDTGNRGLARGLRCSGRYCDDLRLLGGDAGYAPTSSWWTSSFSEEGEHWRVCDNDGFVTGLDCSGDYCDNVSLRCSALDGTGPRAECFWTVAMSEEDGGRFVAPAGTYVAGASCHGRYCDNLALYLCQPAEVEALDLPALAFEFAPRLRFDQETTTGSGEQSKCFPGDPAAYVAAHAQGASPVSLCNQDYASIAGGAVPTYYIARQVGDDAVVVRYWYFYAWQSTCFGGLGSHAADWESIEVLIVGGELERVAFFQHGGWYSRERGGFQTVDGTHPVGYVGKNSHGTYHDDGGTGGCLYFEDFRNPGGNDYHMDTWRNLAPLWRGAGAPDWMNCAGDACFDGIPHPVEQTGDLRSLGGCNRDGCGKSSVGAAIPFVDDPSGSDHVVITAEHSGLALDVAGASAANGAGVIQWPSWHGDNQRWLVETTGADGTVTLRARHSGKCLDVAGGSQTAGANVVQWSCNGGANQRFRLLPYGDGRFAVQAVHSWQCLDIAGATTDAGGSLIQWPCAWTANQTFTFVP